MQSTIGIRRITNGYLVSKGGGYTQNILGGGSDPGETFYPSKEAMLGDASNIILDAIVLGDKTIEEHERRVAEKRQRAGAGYGGGALDVAATATSSACETAF